MDSELTFIRGDTLGRACPFVAREAGEPLHIEREGALLLKRPADFADETRGLSEYDRRRYVLLCLACAVLELGSD